MYCLAHDGFRAHHGRLDVLMLERVREVSLARLSRDRDALDRHLLVPQVHRDRLLLLHHVLVQMHAAHLAVRWLVRRRRPLAA